MATAERRDELATIRLLGGTRRPGDPHGRARDAPTVAVALAAGAAIAAIAVMGVPEGVRGIALVVSGDARGRAGGGRRAARPRRRRRDRPQGAPRHARGGDAGAGVRMERMARSVLVVDDSAAVPR